MMFYTHCKLCGEEFESEWHFRIVMWKYSHLRRNHPHEFREVLRWKIGVRRLELVLQRRRNR